mmetsp:Transcript_18306/g.42849  ORF Transcript_18306/g.42849 Transcript_18306/m.42849 type:complete len:349 (-) Transcript_18306:136-1182(-)|eukprot:CAMPEP_0178425008 /NCGR_PEP_ID=MMETSP0689_2-20121128/28503_1 /TAXON_ID=160604 /ORGANISM="Amphidinium massartii, Strain CS-259" /LENGTH=348 /DNA_ID=CAMNT_0020046661 /DNA_START=29 /DNA_END=1075 /DNA_ORIENTATION=+
MEDALSGVATSSTTDDEIEYALLHKREVMVYQVPPAASAAGHKAEDWKQCIWRGKMRVVGKGQDLAIKLLDAGNESLFAQCSIPNGDHEKFVERVVDSSRYFVLKITNGNRHAFIGVGFEERNDAFDFNCALADFKSRFVERENEVDEAPKVQAPPKDLSLKEGQKIKISIAGLEGKKKREGTESAGLAPPPGGGGLGGFGLAPPPSSGSSQSRRSAAQQANAMFVAPPPATGPYASAQQSAPQPPAKQDDFSFGDFADFQSAGGGGAAAPAPVDPFAASAAPAAAGPGRSAAADPFASADPFGGQFMKAPAAAASATERADPFAGLASAKPAAAPKQGMLDEFDIFK